MIFLISSLCRIFVQDATFDVVVDTLKGFKNSDIKTVVPKLDQV